MKPWLKRVLTFCIRRPSAPTGHPPFASDGLRGYQRM